MPLRTNVKRGILGLAAAVVSGALTPSAGLVQTAPIAVADIRDSSGNSLGTATFRQAADGVLIQADLHSVPGSPGLRGIHLHETGRCDSPEFESARAHYSPTERQHGLKNPNGPHIGDLVNLDNPVAGSNVEVTPQGTARVRMLSDDASVGPGPAALLDADGATIVIHSATDDNRSNPAGNSGSRTACGVLAIAQR